VRDTLVGIGGTLATVGLGEMNLVFGILAGLSTTVYMILAIRNEIKKKQ
tara:strand:+ start:596 stop:742 length:147 start_codon:yes stop_codon:yes gene_type:complete